MPAKMTYLLSQFEEELGPRSRAAAEMFYERSGDSDARPLLQLLVNTLIASAADPQPPRISWSDEQAAILIERIGNLSETQHESVRSAQYASLKTWIKAHPNDASKIIACLEIIPPDGITIQKALSQVGKQKRVFMAEWSALPDGPRKPIVLKWASNPAERNSDTTEDVAAILERELIAHPLSTVHLNIIGTHLLKNRFGENFLVEKRLDVLSDQWRADGIDECANLLYGIAMALSYIHGHGLVHGDIKPDNLGIDENRYILLDFGICRKQEKFLSDEPTGSMRTRAPELLRGTSKNSRESDIWALGATVLKVSSARSYPLYKRDAPTPSDKSARIALARQLAKRADEDWDDLVDKELTRSVPEPLQSVLRDVLAKDPRKRPTATTLIKLCESALAAYIRIQEHNSVFSRNQEVQEIIKHIHRDPEVLRLMPKSQKRALRDIVKSAAFKPRPEDIHIWDSLNSILSAVDK